MMATPPSRGPLLVLEGPDGVGKTTLCAGLAEQLQSRGHDLLQLSFPGKQSGSLGELVYRVHHEQGPVRVTDMSMLAKQALHVAAHIDAIDRQILPALEEGRVVLLDRYWWSAWVYGLVGGCSPHKLRALVEAERSAWGTVRPTLAVLLRRPTPIDRDDPPTRWQRLSDEYARLAERERRLHPVAAIDNVGTPAAALAALLDLLDKNSLPTVREQSLFEIHRPRALAPSDATSHILPLKPSVVYDTYWRFAAERQEIFFRRLEGGPFPWASDQILAKYKFTNAYRASDRVSQYLIRNVIYRDDLPASADEIFFRIVLFKLFNKIATWTTLEAAFGPITLKGLFVPPLRPGVGPRDGEWRRDLLRRLHHACGRTRPRPSAKTPESPRTPRAHARRLSPPADCRVPKHAAGIHAAEVLPRHRRLSRIPVRHRHQLQRTDGLFRGRVYRPGPGALDGIRKCFHDVGGLNKPEVIKFMADRQEREFERLGLTFRSLWGRRLQLVDCQNIFCEVDKYARVGHPEVQGVSGRSRIKQRFAPKPSLPPPWYPPKWGLNDRIAEWRQTKEPNATRTP